jgi:glutamyl-tRNA reductase
MHQIGVVGLSYRHAGVDEVARFAVPRTEVPARLPALRALLKASEILYVGTCNRVEVLYSTEDGSPAGDSRQEVFRILAGREPGPGEAARILRAWAGEAAVEHLFLVACGLDSAQAGEHEIAAQLRGAWEDSRAARTCGPILDRLVGEALGMARSMRRLAAGVHAPSLAELAADRVLQHLGGRTEGALREIALIEPGERAALNKTRNFAGTPPVALLGVSPMTRRCAAILHEAKVPLVIVNRTLQAAEDLAASVSGEWLSLEDFRRLPPAVSAVVLAAGGESLLDAAALERLKAAASRLPLLIDFGVPPNVDPDTARRAGVSRVGMHDLIEAAQGRRLAQLVRLAPVRAAIDERLARLRTELALRAIGPRLAELRQTFEEIAAAEVARALRGQLRTLDARERAQLERIAATLAHRLAHLPLAGLRAAAVHASSEAVEAFFEGARALRRDAVNVSDDTGDT